jgi:hypothetical protein
MLSCSASVRSPMKEVSIVSDPPRKPVSVFLRCRKCGMQNCFADIPATRVDLAMFRGSEEWVKCRGCGSDMDTMGAFVGERVGGAITRLPDPAS